MFKIGETQTGSQKLITDGTVVYQADGDIRFYSAVPSVNRSGQEVIKIQYPPGSSRAECDNRMRRVNIPASAFDDYCTSRGLVVKFCHDSNEPPNTVSNWIGRIAGFAVLGPPGSMLGEAISTGIANKMGGRDPDYTPTLCAETFQRARNYALQWEQVEAAELEIEAAKTRRYTEYAKKRWLTFFRLQGLKNIDKMSGLEFESAIALLYQRKGYQVKKTTASGDFGVDVVAEKKGKRTVIQVKRYTKKVGVQSVQEIAAGAYYYKADNAIVITTSFFTNQATVLANSAKVELIDRKGLIKMWAMVHKDERIPVFNLQEYEKIKLQIDEILGGNK